MRPDHEPDMIDLHVGARIRLRRKLLGLSQQRLAAALSLTFQQVQKYEGGLNRVSASKLYEVSRALETSIAYFFEGLPGESSGIASSHSDRMVPLFLATPEGLELASLFPDLKRGHTRRRILDLIRAMGDDNQEDVADKKRKPS